MFFVKKIQILIITTMTEVNYFVHNIVRFHLLINVLICIIFLNTKSNYKLFEELDVVSAEKSSKFRQDYVRIIL